MGFKLSIILSGLLVLTASGSFFYIKYLNNQVAVLKSNAIVLETEIEKQNESIKNHLAEQKRVNEQMNVLQEQNQQAMREVKEVRDKFARHDLNNLALMKPGLIERRVNAGTKKVMTDLIELTNPKQFDETVINN
jgi:sensor histidine kinase YesM